MSLEVAGLDVHYGPVQALRAVHLRVEEGEMVALLGPNGAGKTTTLRAVSGLLAPTAGTIRLNGETIAGLPAHAVIGRGLAHLPEGRELFPTMSVYDNLRLGDWVNRKRGGFRERIDLVMDHFPRLRERAIQAAGTLSGGEQQMLAVGRALMSRPRFLLVDELSLGLAPKIVTQLFGILDEINREGTAILLVEQFVHMALDHTDRVYVLVKGEVVAEGPSASLRDSDALEAAYLGAGVSGSAGDEPDPAEKGHTNGHRKRPASLRGQ